MTSEIKRQQWAIGDWTIGDADRCIRVYPFGAAPKELRGLSRYGGDEEWVIVVPLPLVGSAVEDAVVRILAVSEAQREVMPDGRHVWITSVVWITT
jgi:hypothetical protein